MKILWASTALLTVLAAPAPQEGGAAALSRALERTAEVANVRLVSFGGSHDGWMGSGVEVASGQGVSLFRYGDPGAAFEPPPDTSDLVWVRVGDGEAFHAGVPLGGAAAGRRRRLGRLSGPGRAARLHLDLPGEQLHRGPRSPETASGR